MIDALIAIPYNSMMKQNALPIGVFDSGIGGLTVLKSLQHYLPQESFIYLGDTARLPYGTKSQTTVVKYAQNASKFLIRQGVKLLVVACNTASTLALPSLRQQFPNTPIIGVLEPGAQAACQHSKNACIAVIATESTVDAEGYQQAILRLRPDAQILTQSCGLFVALAEEGWTDDPITEAVARRYLEPLLFGNGHQPDCLLLGCTHFPTLTKTIEKVVGNNIALIDSAQTTALAVKQLLATQTLSQTGSTTPLTRFMVTDSPARFARIAKQFLKTDIDSSQIELIETHLD